LRSEAHKERKKGAISMKKIKIVFTFVAVTWLVCYALIFLANVIVFPTPSTAARDLNTQPIVDLSNGIMKVSASSNAALTPTIFQTGKTDFFTRPIIPASLGTIFLGLWLYCGYELSRVGYRGIPRSLK
jgi:zinc transporter ZupT